MQEYKDNKIVKAQEAEIQKLAATLQEDVEQGKADSARIAVVERGDEFEIKGLKFRVTKKHNRGRITAKLIGM